MSAYLLPFLFVVFCISFFSFFIFKLSLLFKVESFSLNSFNKVEIISLKKVITFSFALFLFSSFFSFLFNLFFPYVLDSSSGYSASDVFSFLDISVGFSFVVFIGFFCFFFLLVFLLPLFETVLMICFVFRFFMWLFDKKFHLHKYSFVISSVLSCFVFSFFHLPSNYSLVEFVYYFILYSIIMFVYILVYKKNPNINGVISVFLIHSFYNLIIFIIMIVGLLL